VTGRLRPEKVNLNTATEPQMDPDECGWINEPGRLERKLHAFPPGEAQGSRNLRESASIRDSLCCQV